MRTSRLWHDAAKMHYLDQRVLTVPAEPDALLHACKQARGSDTLKLLPGIHYLSAELIVERPLQILSQVEAERVFSSWQRTKRGTPPSPPTNTNHNTTGCPATIATPPAMVPALAARADGRSSPASYVEAMVANKAHADEVVLVATPHVLLRTRCNARMAGLTLCRMGTAVGYPNAVTYAEAGMLQVDRCRITCGGAAPSVGVALQAFAHVPEPGAVWQPGTLATSGSGSRRPQHSVGMETPQAGVWVGAAARVTLHSCAIASCMGPGVKIYRGRLLAQHSTIAFSSRGANVVANGGDVVLERNAIYGSDGDGVSSWNNSNMHIIHNEIYANAGAGIAVNAGAGLVTIAYNRFFDNVEHDVLFATSKAKATVENNDYLEKHVSSTLSSRAASSSSVADGGATQVELS